MHQSKVSLHLDKTLPHAFDVSDEVQSLEFPFLYVLSGFSIQIVSILNSNTNQINKNLPYHLPTCFLGQIVKVIDFTASLLNQNKKASTFKFDRLTMAHYMEVYLNSS
jgi:hypothetical protein